MELTKTIGAFNIIKNYIPEKNKKQLYYAYVYSKIQYGIEVYGHAKTSYLRKIQTKQNRALKTLFNLDYRSPTLQLHHDLNLLLVKDIKKQKIINFVQHQQRNQTPEVFNNYFIENKTMHSHNTRQITHLHLKSNLGKKSIKYYGAQEWNNIPLAIRKSSNLKSFSNQVKDLILHTYT